MLDVKAAHSNNSSSLYHSHVCSQVIPSLFAALPSLLNNGGEFASDLPRDKSVAAPPPLKKDDDGWYDEGENTPSALVRLERHTKHKKSQQYLRTDQQTPHNTTLSAMANNQQGTCRTAMAHHHLPTLRQYKKPPKSRRGGRTAHKRVAGRRTDDDLLVLFF